MKEITGNLWDYYGKPGYVVCITTNGKVNSRGELVMGRGCAAEAKQRFKGLAKTWGTMVRQHGNICTNSIYFPDLLTFPTKHNWWEESDPELINRSAKELSHWAINNPDKTYVLPRPGCGNGGLRWEDVKPVIQAILPDNVWVISRS